jgi:hypothetical protein
LPKPDTIAGQSPAHRSIRVALPRDDVQGDGSGVVLSSVDILW